MSVERPPLWLTIGLLLVGLALCPAGIAESPSASPDLTGSILSSEAISIDGSLQTDFAPAVGHARSAQPGTLHATLTAAQLEVTYTWRSGERVSASSTGDDVVRASHDEGERTRTFEDASVEIEGFQASPELLVHDRGAYELRIRGEGLVELSSTVGGTLTQIESSNETTRIGDTSEHHGFHYQVDEPSLSIANADTMAVEGDFDLFVNNVTLAVSTAEEDWEHWTGYRERGIGPASAFESRVTRVSVVNGSLDLQATDGVHAIAPEHTGRLSGDVVVDQADGLLSGATADYPLDGDRVALEGSGDFRASLASPSSIDVRDRLPGEHAVPIRFSPEGTFALDGDLDAVETANQDQATSASPVEDWWWAPFGLLGLAGVVAAGRRPLGARLDGWRAELRDRRVTSWMRTGDRLTSVREFDRALKWYDRITQAYPNHAEAWYSKGACLAEIGDHAAAARAYAQANELIGGDDAQLADLAAAEAWEAGEEKLALHWFGELARLEPRRLVRRLEEPGYKELLERDSIRRLLDDLEPEASPSVA